MVKLDRKKIRQYFEGKKQTGPIIMMVLGVITMAIVVGIFLFIIGIAWFLYNKFSADHAGEAEVDKAKSMEIERAKERALKKLNLMEEQIQDVDPVVVSGRGFEPESSKPALKMGLLKQLFGSIKTKIFKVKEDIEDDPIYMARIGSDSKFRSSLISVSVFMFGEKQLFIYYSNIDLCTGLIYSEGTHEYFYSDINAISFMQDKEKVYNFKKRKYQRILFECVKIFANGCHHTATLSTDLDNSVIEKEFTGMRNLIRERKNAN